MVLKHETITNEHLRIHGKTSDVFLIKRSPFPKDLFLEKHILTFDKFFFNQNGACLSNL